MSEMLSSFREKAFLGGAIRNEKLINQIDLTAKKVNSILNPIDDVAKKKVNGESAKLVEGLAEKGEWKTDSVVSLLAAEKDKNRPANQETARNRLDILGKGVYIAMRFGENEEYQDLLGMGSAVEIDEMLPEPLKGLGERVRSNIIEDENILKVLDDLDKTRRLTDKMGKPGEKKLEAKISEALDRLLELNADEAELSMVVSYLGAEMEMRGGGNVGSGADSRVVDEIQKLRQDFENRDKATKAREEVYFENQERQLKLGKEAEDTTYQDWLSTIVGKSGQVALPSAIWAYEPPKYYEGRGTEWNQFLDSVTSLNNKVMTRRSLLGASRDVGKAYYDANYPRIQERYFSSLYNDKRTGFRQALEFVAGDLYVETITLPDGKIRVLTSEEKRNGTKGLFAMKYDVVGVPDKEQEGSKLMSARNEGGRMAYLLRVAENLVDKGVAKDLDQAKMMASMAVDFIELGFGMDGPDHSRKCNFATEAARTKSRPGYKFGAKTEGGEVFSVSWTAFYQERYADEIANSVEIARRSSGSTWSEEKEVEMRNKYLVEMTKRDGLIPQVLCGSILDIEMLVDVKGEDGKFIKMPIGEALSKGIKLLPNEGSTEDLLFQIDKWFENASSFWDYVSGSTKLDFKGGIKEVDAVISDFAKDLNNSYIDLRSRGLVNVQHLVSAIGGAAGLVPSEPMVLNIPVSILEGTTYAFLTNTMLNHMPGLLDSEIKEVKKRLAVNDRISDALSTWWENSKDGRLSKEQKESWKRRLLNKPKNFYEKMYRKNAEKY